MLRSKMTRLLGIAALTGSVGVGSVLIASGPAWAKAEKSITCKNLSGNIGSTIVASNCNGNTGGSSEPLNATTLAAGGTIDWVNGKTTTIAAPTLKTIKNNAKCPSPDTAESFTAKVTGDTTGLTKLGTAKGAVCIDGSGNISAIKPLKAT
jgi:hypothetical protein